MSKKSAKGVEVYIRVKPTKKVDPRLSIVYIFLWFCFSAWNWQQRIDLQLSEGWVEIRESKR